MTEAAYSRRSGVDQREVDLTLLTVTLVPDCPGGFFRFAGCFRSGGGTQLLPSGFNDPQARGILTEGLQVIASRNPADLLGLRSNGGSGIPDDTEFIKTNHRSKPVVLGRLAWPGVTAEARLPPR